MHLIVEQGLQDEGKFAANLGELEALSSLIAQYLTKLPGLGPLDAKLIEERLRSEGYLVQESDPRSMRPHYVAVSHGPKYDKLQKNLFDPMLHISHHVRVESHHARVFLQTNGV